MISTRALQILDLGLISYADALDIQRKKHELVVRMPEVEIILACEHKHVYTFGKSANHSNLLIQSDRLKAIGAEVFQTDRGGDITYHGPGQLVVYPIINLVQRGIGVRNYVLAMESALIKTLDTYGIEAYQIKGLTGIWTKNQGLDQKIGAIGIRVSRGVSMHGFALNLSTDLSYFNHIVPCGITDKGVCSMESIGVHVSMEQFTASFVHEFELELMAKNH